MGLSSKKSTTTTDQTTTPEVPEAQSAALGSFNSTIENLQNSNPESYVPDASALQTSADNSAATLGLAPSQSFTAAQDAANKVLGYSAPTVTAASSGAAHMTAAQAAAAQSQAASLLDGGLSKYMNPDLEDVVNTSLAGFDKQAGATQAALEAQGALTHAFGGSRFGVEQGETTADLAQQRANLEAGLRNTAFTNATGLANEDAARQETTNLANATNIQNNNEYNATNQQQAAADNAGWDEQTSLANQQAQQQAALANAQAQAAQQAQQLQAAGLLGNLGTAQNAAQIGDINTTDALGQEQRSIAQEQATAPLSLAQSIGVLLGQDQIPLQTGQHLTGTNTTTSTPSTMSIIGQGVQDAAAVAKLFAGGGAPGG